MTSTANKEMGKVTTTITVTNQVDEILATRGFISSDEIRSLTINNVLVDTSASRLCLPEDIISQLGLTQAGETDVVTALEARKVRVFQGVKLTIMGREGRYDCFELPVGQEPLIGLIPLEDLGLELDLKNQRLKLLPIEGRDTYLMM